MNKYHNHNELVVIVFHKILISELKLEHALSNLFYIDDLKQNYYRMICNTHNRLYGKDMKLSK